ncbi:hypothetical protein [Desulfurobacterium sp.]
MYRSSFFTWMVEKVQEEISTSSSTSGTEVALDVVYWEPIIGDDSNDGKTKDAPVKTFEKALSLIKPGGFVAIYPSENIDIAINGVTIEKNINIGFADEYYMEQKTETVNITLGTPGIGTNNVWINGCKVEIGVSKVTCGLLNLYNAVLDTSMSESTETAASVNVTNSILKVKNLICNGAILGHNFYYVVSGTVNFPGAAYLVDLRFGNIGTLGISGVTSWTLSDGSTLTDISSRINGLKRDTSGKPLNLVCDIEL